jgi:hypothetical protein
MTHLVSQPSAPTTTRQRTPEQDHLRSEALRFQALGLNVIANKPGTKEPAHYWKGAYKDGKPIEFLRSGKPKPNWTITQQSADDVGGFPWHKAGGLGLVNGPGDVRTFDFDKCSDPAIVGAVLDALDLPANYPWQWQSGSHNGYGMAVICNDLPLGLFGNSGILIGAPRDAGAFDHLELRASGCQTVIPPSLHKTGKHYRWLHEAPSSPPARVSHEQLLVGLLAVAELPRAKPAPEPRPAQRREPIVVAGALTQKAIRDAVNTTHPRDYLESRGSTTRKDGNGSCICGAPHSGDGQITYGREVATCHSTRGDCLLSASGPNGRNSHSTWDLKVTLEYADDWRAAYIAHGFTFPERTSACQEQRQVPEHTTPAAAQRRAFDRERKRAAHCAEAAAIRSEVEQRAATDDRLKPADCATLGAMLAWAAEHNADCCRAGRASLARRAGYSLGAVKRSVMDLEVYGYFQSSGKGGDPFSTAKRTFTCGSCSATQTIFEPNHDPRIDHESDLISKPVGACEGGVVVERAHEPAEAWECWEAYEPEHGADELADLDGLDLSSGNVVMLPAPAEQQPAEPPRVCHNGPFIYLRYADGSTSQAFADERAAQIAAGLVVEPMLANDSIAPLAKPETDQPSADDAAIAAQIAALYAVEMHRPRSATDDQQPLDLPESAPAPKKPAKPNQRALIAAMSDEQLLDAIESAPGIARYGKQEHTRQWAARRIPLLEAERRARGLPDRSSEPRQALSRSRAPTSPPLTSPSGNGSTTQAGLWGAQ